MIVFLVAVCFSSALLSMEDGGGVTSHTSSKVPNKYLTLDVMKAAQALKDSAPSIWMSSGEVMKFCEQYGIDSLCAHPKNKAIHAALRFFFETIDKPIECFYAGTFARDSSSFFASNSGNEHQYLGRNTAIRTMNEKEMLYGGEEEVAAPPIFSPNGRWLIGWANYNKLAIRDLDQFVIDQESRESFVDGTWNHQKGIISDTPVAYLSLPEETEPEETDLQDHTLDYALDNKTIIIQKGAALFCAATLRSLLRMSVILSLSPSACT